MQYASGILLPPVQTLVATIIFAKGENAKNPSHSCFRGGTYKVVFFVLTSLERDLKM
jgi:hypothetical protein